MIRRIRIKQGAEMSKVHLAFATVQSETTLDVKLVIPTGKIWHVLRNNEGIYLVDRNKPKDERDFHPLSRYADPKVPRDPGIKIDYRDGMFIIPYTRCHFEYSFNGSEYMQLASSRQFMEEGVHRFRCGSLEFDLQLVKSLELSQKEFSFGG